MPEEPVVNQVKIVQNATVAINVNELGKYRATLHCQNYFLSVSHQEKSFPLTHKNMGLQIYLNSERKKGRILLLWRCKHKGILLQ